MVERLRPQLRAYGSALADRAIARLKLVYHAKAMFKQFDPGDLIDNMDDEELLAIIQQAVIRTIEASWDTWNGLIDVNMPFNMRDDAVVKAISGLPVRVVKINDKTREAIREMLRVAEAEGWSIGQIARGDVATGMLGIRDIVEQLYRNRDKAIARTELGLAQNNATQDRYAAFGVEKEMVLDGGGENSDEDCNMLNGMIVSAEWADTHPLGHPNCVRAFAAWFGDDPVEDPDVEEWGD
jgi:hypothetical protein